MEVSTKMAQKKRIIISVQEGLIQDVWSSDEADVTIYDFDGEVDLKQLEKDYKEDIRGLKQIA